VGPAGDEDCKWDCVWLLGLGLRRIKEDPDKVVNEAVSPCCDSCRDSDSYWSFLGERAVIGIRFRLGSCCVVQAVERFVIPFFAERDLIREVGYHLGEGAPCWWVWQSTKSLAQSNKAM
jgi:hypothetical protein